MLYCVQMDLTEVSKRERHGYKHKIDSRRSNDADRINRLTRPTRPAQDRFSFPHVDVLSPSASVLLSKQGSLKQQAVYIVGRKMAATTPKPKPWETGAVGGAAAAMASGSRPSAFDAAVASLSGTSSTTAPALPDRPAELTSNALGPSSESLRRAENHGIADHELTDAQLMAVWATRHYNRGTRRRTGWDHMAVLAGTEAWAHTTAHIAAWAD